MEPLSLVAAQQFTEAEITESLLSVIAWAGNHSAAHRALTAEGKHVPTLATLHSWTRELHAVRYEELRERHAEVLEKQLIGDARELVAAAYQLQRAALAKALDRLDDDKDPSRTAANAATVADKNVRDMLSLSGRPTSIREDRNLEQIMRSLAAKGIVRFDSEEPAELPAGEAK